MMDESTANFKLQTAKLIAHPLSVQTIKETPLFNLSAASEIQISKNDLQIHIHFQIQGPLSTIKCPLQAVIQKNVKKPSPVFIPTKKDFQTGLWASTCLELFLKPETSDEYFEINLTPEGHWACFLFSEYRILKKQQTDLQFSKWDVGLQDVAHQNQTLNLSTSLKLKNPFRPKPDQYAVGLTAVIEHLFPEQKQKLGADSVLSYWALRHHSEKPDFHHPGTFRSATLGSSTESSNV